MARVSAASARAHTRKHDKSMSPLSLLLGQWHWIMILGLSTIMAYSLMAIRPPAPNVCGSPNGPPVTEKRVKLRDGRHLAYKQRGVSKEEAKYKVIAVHAFGRSRHDVQLYFNEEVLNELSIHLVGFDRAGYGQSDPYSQRSLETEAHDIEDLADQLQLGSQIFIVSNSIGGYTSWACLKYIPHRLGGVAMVAPVINYWWDGLASVTLDKAWKSMPLGDRLAPTVAHYAPWLLYWYMNQKWVPASSTVRPRLHLMSQLDLEIRKNMSRLVNPEIKKETLQQGTFESMHRDMMVMFGKWEFSPLTLNNPFEPNSARVHIWQGDRDHLVSVTLQRYIHEKLPWIEYHELPDHGHYLLAVPGLSDKILRTLVLEA